MQPVTTHEMEQVSGGFTLTVLNLNAAVVNAIQANAAIAAIGVSQTNGIVVGQSN